jgi:RNA polymerase sigma-70 factor (sigma-E family)
MPSRAPDFDQFVSENADALLRTAYLIVFDLPEAEDLVQETLFKVAKRWPKVRRMDHPVAYARRILVNAAIDGATKRARRRAELAADEPPELATPTQDERHDDLHQALAALPPRQRAVLVLRYFLDLPEAEVAAALDCSLGTVKSTASRALARLELSLRPVNDPPRSLAS